MLARIRRSPALMAFSAVALLTVVVFGWWTISPLFIRTTANEGMNIAIPTIQPTPAGEMMAEPTATPASMMAEATPTAAPMMGEAMMAEATPTPAAMMEEPMMAEPSPTPAAMMGDSEMAAEIPTPTAEAMMAEPVMAEATLTPAAMMGPQVLAVGNFDHQDAIHYADGQAIIARQEDGTYIVRLQDLDAANGPDLFVYVSEHPDPSNSDELHQGGHNLGVLKATTGSFNYTLDPAIDPTKLRSVVIYCRAFSVIFSVATLS